MQQPEDRELPTSTEALERFNHCCNMQSAKITALRLIYQHGSTSEISAAYDEYISWAYATADALMLMMGVQLHEQGIHPVTRYRL